MPLVLGLLYLVLSPGDILLLAAIVFVLFGASRLPQLGKGLGEGIRNFKRGLQGDESPPQQLEKRGGDGTTPPPGH